MDELLLLQVEISWLLISILSHNEKWLGVGEKVLLVGVRRFSDVFLGDLNSWSELGVDGLEFSVSEYILYFLITNRGTYFRYICKILFTSGVHFSSVCACCSGKMVRWNGLIVRRRWFGSRRSGCIVGLSTSFKGYIYTSRTQRGINAAILLSGAIKTEHELTCSFYGVLSRFELRKINSLF